MSSPVRELRTSAPLRRLMSRWACALMVLALCSGCAAQKYLITRDVPANPLAIQLQLTSKAGPQVSPRTESMLRRYDLLELYKTDIAGCLERLQSLTESEPNGELVYGVAELAYIAGKRAEKEHNEALALDMHGVAVS
ncbi:MAG: hypothetical protein ACTHK7_16785, partial [Aureliella sp.]